MKIILLLPLLFLPIFCWSAPPSHCTTEEKVYFSCMTNSKERVLSVCGSPNLSTPTAYLQYRFGPLDKKELEFPIERKGSIQQFRIYHYFRASVDRIGLTFQSGDFSYEVYDDYEGDIQPPEKTSGVVVSKNETDTETGIPCKGEVTNQLIDLKNVVPEDDQSDL